MEGAPRAVINKDSLPEGIDSKVYEVSKLEKNDPSRVGLVNTLVQDFELQLISLKKNESKVQESFEHDNSRNAILDKITHIRTQLDFLGEIEEANKIEDLRNETK